MIGHSAAMTNLLDTVNPSDALQVVQMYQAPRAEILAPRDESNSILSSLDEVDARATIKSASSSGTLMVEKTNFLTHADDLNTAIVSSKPSVMLHVHGIESDECASQCSLPIVPIGGIPVSALLSARAVGAAQAINASSGVVPEKVLMRKCRIRHVNSRAPVPLGVTITARENGGITGDVFHASAIDDCGASFHAIIPAHYQGDLDVTLSPCGVLAPDIVDDYAKVDMDRTRRGFLPYGSGHVLVNNDNAIINVLTKSNFKDRTGVGGSANKSYALSEFEVGEGADKKVLTCYKIGCAPARSLYATVKEICANVHSVKSNELVVSIKPCGKRANIVQSLDSISSGNPVSRENYATRSYPVGMHFDVSYTPTNFERDTVSAVKRGMDVVEQSTVSSTPSKKASSHIPAEFFQ